MLCSLALLVIMTKLLGDEKNKNPLIPSKKFVITSTCGPNGSIYPLGDVKATSGEDKNFLFMPKLGYVVDTILIDNKSDKTAKNYTFKSINSPHSIHVTFKIASVISINGLEINADDELSNIALGFENFIGDYAIGLNKNGSIVTWGKISVKNPKEKELKNAALFSNFGQLVAVKKDSSLLSWGGINSDLVKAQEGLTGVVSVAFMEGATIVLKSDGTIMGWVSNENEYPYQDINGIIGLSGGASHLLFLLQDGTVKARGDKQFNKTKVPENLTGVIAVAAGRYHSVALKSDGTVVVWGQNSFVPKDLRNVKAIAAGNQITAALKEDGTVVCWELDIIKDIPKNLPPATGIKIGGKTLVLILKKDIK